MNNRLVLLMVLTMLCQFANSQVPSGAVAEYLFTDMSLEESHLRSFGTCRDPEFQTDRFGRETSALGFSDDDDNQVFELRKGLIDINSDFTICFWLKITEVSEEDFKVVFSSRFDLITYGKQGLEFGIEMDSTLIGVFRGEKSLDVQPNLRLTGANLDSWHMVTFTRHYDTVMFFWDKTSAYRALVKRDTRFTNGDLWTFGSNLNGESISREFSGAVDDIRFYTRYLTPKEREKLFYLDDDGDYKAPKSGGFVSGGISFTPDSANQKVTLSLKGKGEIRMKLSDGKVKVSKMINGDAVLVLTWEEFMKGQSNLSWVVKN